VSKISSKNF